MVIVQKYGGTSVSSVERIKAVAERIGRTRDAGHTVAVVVSAMGDTTDNLISLAQQISAHPSPREMDLLMTTGEQVSASLLAMALQERGVDAVAMTGWQAGFVTEPVFGKARIQEIRCERVQQALERGQVVIITGFQGATETGEINTLGRGGSDTSAVALAAAIGADVCEIYTDVDGVYTSDPRVVKRARKLSAISYDEMLELANLGAGVLHPRAVECAKWNGVKLIVRSSFNEEEGTIIEEVPQVEKGLVVTGVAAEKNVVKVQVYGLPNQAEALASLFSYLAQNHINVDVIVLSEHGLEKVNVAFTISVGDKEQARALLEKEKEALGFDNVAFEEGLAKVSIVGAGMISNPGVAASMFRHLAEAGIAIKMISTSEIKVSCVIDEGEREKAMVHLHQAFGLDAAAGGHS